MRGIVLLSLATVAACASSGTGGSSHPETMRVVGGNGTSSSSMTMTATAAASTTSLAYPLDRIWRALPAVYDSLGIELTVADATKHLIGNEGMKIRQRLGGVALSVYIDCGQAQIGQSADSYEIFMNVTTVLQTVSATETRLSTTVDASGRPITFSQAYSRCSSKGTLETRIAAILAARLAAPK